MLSKRVNPSDTCPFIYLAGEQESRIFPISKQLVISTEVRIRNAAAYKYVVNKSRGGKQEVTCGPRRTHWIMISVQTTFSINFFCFMRNTNHFSQIYFSIATNMDSVL